MPKPYPAEFRRNVVAVARKNEAPLFQIAKDFGVSEATLHNWLKKADIEDGIRPGVTADHASEIRAMKRRMPLLDWFNHRRLYERCGDVPPAELEAYYYGEHRTTRIMEFSNQ